MRVDRHFFVYASIILKVKEVSKKSWPVSEAEIISVKVMHEKASDRGAENRSAGYQWALEVKYSFVANGENVYGSAFSNVEERLTRYVSESYGDGSKLPKEVNEYKNLLESSSHKKTVHYNPDNHEENFLFLESGNSRSLIFFLIGVMLLAPGVFYGNMLFSRF